MEYERALFRVYDKVMEDVDKAVASVRSSSTSSPSLSSLNRRTGNNNTIQPLPPIYLPIAPIFPHWNSLWRRLRVFNEERREVSRSNNNSGVVVNEEETSSLTSAVDSSGTSSITREDAMNGEDEESQELLSHGRRRRGSRTRDLSPSSSVASSSPAVPMGDLMNRNSMTGERFSVEERQQKVTWGAFILCNMPFVLMVLGLFDLFCVVSLHRTYATSTRVAHMSKNDFSSTFEAQRSMGNINCISNILSKRKSYEKNFGNSTGQPFLLRDDEILQIKILKEYQGYESYCADEGKVCSKIIEPLNNAPKKKHRYHENNDLDEDFVFGGEDHGNGIDYRFSMSDALLYLDESFMFQHNVSLINITVTDRCLVGGSDDITDLSFEKKFAEFWTRHAAGYDVPIVNQLMQGILNMTEKEDLSFVSGYVISNRTGSSWSWRKEALATNRKYSGLMGFFRNPYRWGSLKIFAIVITCLSFLMITSVTSIIVRVLTASGVVLMYPFFSCLRQLGLNASERILALSYPWIGVAMHRMSNPPQQSQRDRHSISLYSSRHMVTSQITKVFLYYLMYEACQVSWSSLLYGVKSQPQGLPIFLFGMVMIWEYFVVIFMRSATSAHFFPRVALLLYGGWNFYFFSEPFGYFQEAAMVMFLFSLQAMLYCLLILEPRVHRNGLVNMECPREVYTSLPWEEWSATYPSEWTLFLPLNSRNIPLHDISVEMENQTASSADQNNNDHPDDDDDDDEGYEDDSSNEDVEEYSNSSTESPFRNRGSSNVQNHWSDNVL